jgi:Domain of unknown function (DUF4397)
MKKILTISALALSFTSLVIGCKKELKLEAGIRTVDTQNKALLKIVNASAYTVIDSVQLKINDVRVSNSIRYTTPFPGGGLNTGGSNFPWYLETNPGASKISFTVPKKTTNFDSLHLYSTNVNLDAGKYYTLYTADTSIKTQTVLVNENMSAVPNGVSRFKFVNLMPNLPALDVYFADQLVASNIAYKAVSPEFTIASGTVGKWAIRKAGDPSTTAAIVTYPTGTTNQTIPNRTNFSVYSRGYSSATSNRAPNISLTYN